MGVGTILYFCKTFLSESLPFHYGIRMESIKRKIHETEDVADVIGLMQNLNIPTIGCETVKQMKERIFDHLLSREDSHLASNEVR